MDPVAIQEIGTKIGAMVTGYICPTITSFMDVEPAGAAPGGIGAFAASAGVGVVVIGADYLLSSRHTRTTTTAYCG